MGKAENVNAVTKARYTDEEFLIHDQLYFPYALTKAGCRTSIIEQSYLRCPALEYVRNKRVA